MTDEQVEPAEHAAEGAVEDLRIAAFWQAARGHVGMGKMDQVLGGTAGRRRAAAVVVLRRRRRGGRRCWPGCSTGARPATALAVAELAQVGLEVPRVGDLSIVVDGAGDPRALLRTTEVEVVPFDQVTAEHAAAEAEGDGTLESWRAQHEASWRRVLGEAFSPSLEVDAGAVRADLPDDRPDPRGRLIARPAG